MKRMILQIFIMLLVSTYIFDAMASNDSAAIVSSQSKCQLGINESLTIEIEVAGLKQKETISARVSKKGICDIAWGEAYRKDNGVAIPLTITGIATGSVTIKRSI